MNKAILVGLASLFLLGITPACGGSDDGSGSGGKNTGGTGGGTGGTGGGTGGTGGGTGGAAGSGGAAGGGGAAGSGGAAGGGGAAGAGATGGAAGGGGTGGGTGGGGTGGGGTGGGSGFWPGAYDANCTAKKSAPPWHTSQQADCLTCHKSGGGAPAWLFGGVVFQADGTTGAAHVEVGVSDGTNFVLTCTDSKGLFYAPVAGSPSITWSSAETRIRNGNGEKAMKGKPPTGACLSCHGSGAPKLIQP